MLLRSVFAFAGSPQKRFSRFDFVCLRCCPKNLLWGVLVFFVAYVLFLFGAELEVGDGSYEGINTESKGSEPEIRAGSAGVSFGLKTGMVDDDTADPTEEEGK